MFGAICVFFFKLFGWKIEGAFPGENVPKYIIIVAPHTSFYDYFIGVATRRICKIDSKYLGKAELFKFPPLGWFFRSMGGYPVDRSKNNNMVDAVVEIFNSKEKFSIALTPEGTRRKVYKWKTGFYHIAQKANVPVVKVAFDFGNRKVRVDKPLWVTGEKDMEILEMMKYFEGIKGKNPELGVSLPTA
jgi:1-acyl-sn-glycerol-3-phosphate acyltransferase